MDRWFDHVGVVVTDLARASVTLSRLGYTSGVLKTFSAEGTKEVYMGEQWKPGRLLLIEPISSGPYRDALEARGPGLHHIAIGTVSIEMLLSSISGAGWYLHPKSFESFRLARTVWLARPGVRSLVEVIESDDLPVGLSDSPIVSRVELPLAIDKPLLFSALRMSNIEVSQCNTVAITIGGHRIDPAKL